MSNKTNIEQLLTIPINAFAYELIREELLPDIIGKELDRILYWAGKNLARKYTLETFEDIIVFFRQAGWGDLSIVEQNRRELQLQLTSPLIGERYKNKQNTTYQLEAGFLAQQTQQQRQVIAEAYEDPKKRSEKVLFTVKWDAKDPLNT
ncbi:YslB family protein [Ectobacillus funiculus]|uniref:YslB family protein n=1 Tax=Ectobacillus funiculus TaxID=137993 RepID=A0ABV5WIT7_9BACI|nr:YslB family protein [Ectobacillus funiculus]